MPGCPAVGAAERPAVSEASMEEEGEPRALRVHQESPPRWPRGLVTAATQRSFIRGLTWEMLTHCYAHQSGDAMPITHLPIRSFRSRLGPAPASLCLRICSYRGDCPGEGGSARSDWAGPPHPQRGPEPLHTLCWGFLLALPPLISTWDLQSQPYPCPRLPTLILPLPTPAYTYPTPAHTCPHLSTPVLYLSTLVLPLPTTAHTCLTPAHICLTPAHTCPHLPYTTPHLPDLPGPTGRGVSTGSRTGAIEDLGCKGAQGLTLE